MATPQQSTDDLIREIHQKIIKQKNIIAAARSMQRISSQSSDVGSRFATTISESEDVIRYLESTLQSLKLEQKVAVHGETESGDSDATLDAESSPGYGNGNGNGHSNSNSSSSLTRPRSIGNGTSIPTYSRLDLTKHNCPSLGQKIQLMLQIIEFKLSVEEQYKIANARMAKLYRLEGDKQSSFLADSGILESTEKIKLLKKAAKKYQLMRVGDFSGETDVARDKLRMRPLSGRLNVFVHSIKSVEHFSTSSARRGDAVLQLKVDNKSYRTRPAKSDIFNEEFDIQIDKANEIEITVLDKTEDGLYPVAMTWVLLSDIVEELRKRKIAQEAASGWVSAAGFGGSQGAQGAQGGQGMYGSGNGGVANVGGATGTYNANVPYGGSAITTPQTTTTSGAQTTSVVLTLEPAGLVSLTFSFVKADAKAKRREALGALDRHGAIKKRNDEVYEQHGHQFVQRNLYNVVCCALCGDFVGSSGFQCEDCRLMCHKKCYTKIITKCISKSSSDIDPDAEKLNYRIPHRFETFANKGTKWCCHCGYILPWSKKSVRKCVECGVMCHAGCAHLVPDLCGMTMEQANELLSTIRATNEKKQAKAETRGSETREAQRGAQLRALEAQKDQRDQREAQRSALPSIPGATGVTGERLDAVSGTGARKPVYADYTRRPPNYDSRRAPGAQKPVPQLPQKTVEPIVAQQSLKAEQNVALPQPNMEMAHSVAQPGAQTVAQPVEEVALDPALRQQLAVHNSGGSAATATSVPSVPSVTSQGKPRRHKRKIGLDDFQFLAVLGKGNFGKVMLAESRTTKQLCAIKVLKKDFIIDNDEVESARSEKRVFLIANKEKHPFLLNLHCCFQTENRIYFVMEYVSGGDLMWHIQKERFSPRRAQFYAAEVLLALKYFHENGVIYRDLKLDNILLTLSGHVKIADYGLCKENMGYGQTTRTFCGTPEFMAPEILREQRYGKAIDWWAFGVLLYQMLLGQSPFKGDDEEEIFDAILSDEPLYPIQMQRDAVSVLQGLLTRDPERRLGAGPRDAAEIMEHPYFGNIDFDALLRLEIPPPYIPEFDGPLDISHFDEEFTNEAPKLTPVNSVLGADKQEYFRGFSYVNEELFA